MALSHENRFQCCQSGQKMWCLSDSLRGLWSDSHFRLSTAAQRPAETELLYYALMALPHLDSHSLLGPVYCVEKQGNRNASCHTNSARHWFYKWTNSFLFKACSSHGLHQNIQSTCVSVSTSEQGDISLPVTPVTLGKNVASRRKTLEELDVHKFPKPQSTNMLLL